TTENEL
ncbi:hypothetical protein AVEN_113799-1, partial [Araneus ventricosus]